MQGAGRGDLALFMLHLAGCNTAEARGMGELARLSATSLLEGYARKSFSPVDAVDDIIAMLETIQPRLNVLVTPLFDQARAAARAAAEAWAKNAPSGPLCGVPITVKDLIYMAGVRACAGAPLLKDFVAPSDGAAVERVKRAGAVILGKTTTCEAGYKLTADSPLTGITRNPWNRDRTSGGSSGGAAAALAAGAGPLALGTDAVGSIRVPSAFCGVFGLKPTFGLVPRSPGFSPPSWGSLAHTGPMTRTVADAALLLGVIAGYDRRDGASLPVAPRTYDGAKGGIERLRIAYSPAFGFATVAPAVADAVESAVQTLATLGARIDRRDPAIAPDVLETTLKPIGYTEQATAVLDRSEAELALSEPEFRAVAAQGRRYSGTDYMAATHRRAALRETFRRLFDECDLLVSPAVACTAFAAGEIGVEWIGGRKVDKHLGWSPFSWPINLAGLPAASVPIGFDDDGLPIGLQIVGPWLGEDAILRVAAALEATRPWSHLWPKVPS
jgi:aspartyl-tRNA(Asn)/glutamyl-tRNA(Gln) amidotransferase subunit A